MTTINVSFYWIKHNIYNSLIAFNDFDRLLGDNFPIPMPLEGGSYDGLQYYYCIKSDINVIEICKKYNYEYSEYETIEVPINTYNNNYRVDKSNKKFKLTVL
jgi:hypothetical protein